MGYNISKFPVMFLLWDVCLIESMKSGHDGHSYHCRLDSLRKGLLDPSNFLTLKYIDILWTPSSRKQKTPLTEPHGWQQEKLEGPGPWEHSIRRFFFVWLSFMISRNRKFRDLSSSVFMFGASRIPAGVSACHLKRLPRRVKSEELSHRTLLTEELRLFHTSQWMEHIEIPHVFWCCYCLKKSETGFHIYNRQYGCWLDFWSPPSFSSKKLPATSVCGKEAPQDHANAFQEGSQGRGGAGGEGVRVVDLESSGWPIVRPRVIKPVNKH